MQKGLAPILVLIIFVIAAVAGGTYYLGTQKAGGPLYTSQPTPQPSPTPDEIANWKTYTNTKYRYSFKYPSLGYELSDSAREIVSHTGEQLSALINEKSEGPSFPIFYISVYPPDIRMGIYNSIIIEKFALAKIGSIVESKPLNFEYISNIKINNETAKVFKGFGSLHEDIEEEKILIIDKGDIYYVIGTYHETSNKYQQILSTFKFIE